ncbi:MAG: DUF1223 domain-containing protein [Silicimonas sp.]|nr:DUF1223 domain-containing protein [Silicimonas sp.]
MTRLAQFATALWLAVTGTAMADQPVVVELFTSQGCSSCPPADRILGQLAERDDVIALGYHVDYWDYLGWKDKFADPANTQRQRAYARAKGERSIYTPQMIIGGKDHVIGSKPMKISELIRKHARGNAPVQVRAKRSGGQLLIEAQAMKSLRGGAVVQLVTFLPKSTVDVRRGENAGRKLAYHNIVQSHRVVGNWDGRGAYRVKAKVAPGVPVVVLVQAKGAGPILGAAMLR